MAILAPRTSKVYSTSLFITAATAILLEWSLPSVARVAVDGGLQRDLADPLRWPTNEVSTATRSAVVAA